MVGAEQFISTFRSYAEAVLMKGRLIPVFSKPRILEAHGAWQNDIHRVGEFEKNLGNGLDHFKQCGHLAYWLRRMSPVVEAHDITTNIADAEGYALSDGEIQFRKLMLGYCNEYLSFDLGFQIVKFYEKKSNASDDWATKLQPSTDYLMTICHFLKYKHVSPHSLHLIYKSLFAH